MVHHKALTVPCSHTKLSTLYDTICSTIRYQMVNCPSQIITAQYEMVHSLVPNSPWSGIKMFTAWYQMVYGPSQNGPRPGPKSLRSSTKWSTSWYKILHGPLSNGSQQGIKWSTWGHTMVHVHSQNHHGQYEMVYSLVPNGPRSGMKWFTDRYQRLESSMQFFFC